MQAIFILIIIAIAAAVFGVFQGTPESPQDLEEPDYQGSSQTQYQQSPGTDSGNQAVEPYLTSNPSLQTYIKYGPSPGEVIENETEITFGFSADVPSGQNRDDLIFETKVIGLETVWQSTSREERTIELPSGPGTYTFMVRARIGNQVDPTPIERSFGVGVSPYYGKVTISRFKVPNPPNNPSLLTLRINLEKGETVDLTGWEIKGKWGKITISQGTEGFNFQLRPVSVKNILAKDEDTVYISSAHNPFWTETYNFRPNKCMGYLENSTNFVIPVGDNCPNPKEITFPSQMTRDCREYILDLDRCQSAKYEDLQDLNLYGDSVCMGYIETNLNYEGCYRDYQWDEDFLEEEWHIYANRPENEIFDYNKDTVYLRDESGYLVDQYSYGD